MSTVNVQPGAQVAGDNNTDYVLMPGKHRPIEIPGTRYNFSIRWSPGAILDAGGAEFGIRINDGCRKASLYDPVITNAGHGGRITVCQALLIDGGNLYGNGVEGMHVSACPKAVIRRLKSHNNGAFRFQTYTRDQCHGLYCAYDMSGAVLEDLDLYDNPGSGLQFNAASIRQTTENVTASRLALRRNGGGGEGTPSIALMSVRSSTFTDLLFDHPDTGCVTCHSDGEGEDYACYDNRFTGITILGNAEWDLKQEDGSSRNLWLPQDGWTPPPGWPDSVPVDPGPGPGPGPQPPPEKTISISGTLAVVVDGTTYNVPVTGSLP